MEIFVSMEGCNVPAFLVVIGKNKTMLRVLSFVLAMTVICFSCSKNKADAGDTVEIYLLKTFQTIQAKCQVDPSASTLQDAALVKNQDILEYSKNNYQFKLKDAAIQKIKSLNDRTPFAVTVDKQVIYYGFFKPSISSSSCDNSITMDVDWGTGNKISLKLGYPGQMAGIAIEDKRNDPKLIATLRKQGKLN